VPQKLKEAHDSGCAIALRHPCAPDVVWNTSTECLLLTHRFSVVLISNQSIKSSQLAEWKKKIPLIAAAVRTIRLHAANRLSTSLTFQ
jgi:hypothetical protein